MVAIPRADIDGALAVSVKRGRDGLGQDGQACGLHGRDLGLRASVRRLLSVRSRGKLRYRDHRERIAKTAIAIATGASGFQIAAVIGSAITPWTRKARVRPRKAGDGWVIGTASGEEELERGHGRGKVLRNREMNP
jgi:hypothetical protein